MINYSIHNQQQPTITGLSGDYAELLFQDVTTSETDIYKIHYDGGWGGPFFVSTGTDPSSSVGHTTAKYIWTNGSAAPYQIKTSTETLSKTAAKPLEVVYHRSTAVLDTVTGAWLEVRMDKLSVKTRSGEEFIIPFADAKEDSLTLSPANAFTNLASSLVTLPVEAESLSVECQVNGQRISAMRNGLNLINVEFVLARKGGATIELPVVNTTDDGLPEKKRSLSKSIRAFAGKEVSLQVQVSGVAQQKSSLIASLGHIYEIVEAPLPKVLAHATEMATPQDFALEVYPNPFNPSTQLRFDMNEAGIARLRIYNLNGQQIRELLYEHRVAGEHTITWDGRDENNSAVASGVYFVRFEARNEVKVSKVMLVR